MVTQIETQDDLIVRIAGMQSIEESAQVRDAMQQYKEHATDQEYEIVRRALSKRLNELADEFEAGINEIDDLLRVEGKTYKLDEWLTIADYAKKYGIDRHLVDRWIDRKIIPADDIIILTKINNTRMVKDRVYK